MNTVLDDNKKLCLNSGQIIKLKPTMTMMFEVEDLSQASPATVSRCGMVLLEPQQLGYLPLIQSYVNYLAKILLEKDSSHQKTVDKLKNVLIYFSDLAMEFVRLNCKFPVPTGPNFLVCNTLQIFDTFVREYQGEEAKPIPTNIEDILMNAVVFSAIWGVGGQIEETSRPKFDKFLLELISGEDVQERYKIDVPKVPPMKIPNKIGNDVASLFELAFNKESVAWM
jgi:dynein heavy chain